MSAINKKKINIFLYKHLPIILLFTSVLNELDLNYLDFEYFSFNFSYILIFYFNLKRSQGIGYVFVFIAGLFNDVILGIPIGLSSLMFLILCVATSYLRNITLSPSLIKDSIFFLVTILIINSLLFFALNFIFDYELDFFDQIINITFTFLLYFLFSSIFNYFEKFLVGSSNVR